MNRPDIFVDFCDWGGPIRKNEAALFQLVRRYFPIEVTDRPDFVFYSHTGHVHRLHSGVRIFYTSEADRPPDWRVCDYALTPLCSDDPRHLRVPPYVFHFSAEDLTRQPGEAERVFREKTKFCAFLSTYRNSKTRHRWDFFEKLNARKKVDSGGGAGNNIGAPVPPGVPSAVKFLRPYKFFLAFENKIAPGYIAERLPLALAARCVPIYFGCPEAAQDFNPRRFLNYHDFPSEEALIERILEIDADDRLFRSIIEEPPFNDNRPSRLYQDDYYIQFFSRVFNEPIVPAAVRAMQGWRRLLGRWTLAKRDRPHPLAWSQKGG